jgi:hypothetical protein
MPASQHAVFIALVLASGVTLATALSAAESDTPRDAQGSMMSPGMMGGNSMMNMMGTSQMPDMTEHCTQMMGGGSGTPNEQWRQNAPAAPDENK